MLGGKICRVSLVVVLVVVTSSLVFAINGTNISNVSERLAEPEAKIPDFIELTKYTVPRIVYRGQVFQVNVTGYFYYHIYDPNWNCRDFDMDLVIAEDDILLYEYYWVQDDEYVNKTYVLPGSECVWMGFVSGNFVQYRYPFSYSYDIDFSSEAGPETDLEIILYLEVDVPYDLPGGDVEFYRFNTTVVLEDTNPPPTPQPKTDPYLMSSTSTVRLYDYAVTDTESGIDHYEYKIDDGPWHDKGTLSEFDVVLSDGRHNIYIKAVDRAGNTATGSVDIYVDTSPPECSSGYCCENSHWLPAGSSCNQRNPTYECRDGNMPGSDVYVRYEVGICTDYHACEGTYYTDWEVVDDCGAIEYCANDGDSSCTSCSTTCDYSCQSASCYGIDPDCTSGGSSGECNVCSGGVCQDDRCDYNPSLPCVGSDGCLRPTASQTYWMCQQAIETEYACKNGYMADDDVYYREKNRYCSGISPFCDGPIAWGAWDKVVDCSDSERCANDGDTLCTAVSPEVCDSIDNDYDGQVDEDLVGSLCSLQQGVCSGSRQQCVNGAWQSCSLTEYGPYYEASELSCDNRDNDCDGSVDESLVISCGFSDLGACQYGTQTCTSGQWGECIGEIGPTTETCNGIDDDCDGTADEDIIDPPLCSLQQGVCEGSEKTCSSGSWQNCGITDYGPDYEITEVSCDDGYDNDCDGLVDDNDTDCEPPIINILSPVNNTLYQINFVDLNWTVDKDVDWCAYSLDSGINKMMMNYSVECWGYNYYGQANPYNGGDATQVSAGWWHTCILKSNGSVDCYGDNWAGQSNPYDALDNIQVSAGEYHTCVLKTNSNVECWGRNTSGQSNPYLGSDATHVVAGDDHTCALKSNGNVECWGRNDFNQLNSYNGGDAVQVAIGAYHSCILKSNGNVECWGANFSGQASPYIGGDATQVSARDEHTCILKSNGNVDCHGYNFYGAANDYAKGDAIQVAAGVTHTCVLKSDNNVECWGSNLDGQSNPYNGGDATQVSAGYAHTCVITRSFRSITLTDLLEGTHNLTIYCNDTSGNMGQSEYVYFEVDTVAPTINIIHPTNGTTYASTTLDLNWTTNEDVNWCAYSLDGLANDTSISGPTNITLTGLLDGQHSIIVYCNDTAGNIGQSDYIYFTIDSEPPNIAISSPLNNTTYNINEIDLNWTVNEEVDWCAYSLDGGTNDTSISGPTNIILTGLSDGQHIIIIHCNDTAGNIGQSDYVYFIVDTTPPEIAVFSPINGTAYNPGEIDLNWTVNEEVDWCAYSLDGGTNDTGISGPTNITLINFKAASHNLTIFCNDTIGNMGQSNYVYFIIKNLPPLMDTIPNIVLNQSDLIRIEVSAIDPNNDVLYYYINDSRFKQDSNTFRWQTFYGDAGVYNVLITVSDGELNVSQNIEITVLDKEPPIAYFNGYINDSGLDTNNNSFYENLIISVGINVLEEGEYILNIGISCPGGWGQCGISRTSGPFYLPEGNLTHDIYFLGPWWHNTGVDGPYVVSGLAIRDPSGNLLDEVEDTYLTKPYSYMDFEGYFGEFTNKYYDYGNDTDGDGLYDYLTIRVGLNVSREGEFDVQGSLWYGNRSSGSLIGTQKSNVYLEKGEANVTLNFLGWLIGKSLLNGNSYYTLVGLTLYDDDGNIHNYIEDAHKTSDYNYTQFEPLPATFTGNFSDYGLDTDGDTFYNYLVIEVGLNVTEAGEYFVFASLEDNNDQHISYASEREWFSKGIHTVELFFDGILIYNNSVDGPYNLTYVDVYDGNPPGYISDHAEGYITSPYTYTDFEKPNSIKGYVFDSLGNPIFNVSIELDDKVNWYYYLNMTDTNGFFQFTDLPDSLYELNINEINQNILENYTSVTFRDASALNLTAAINLTNDLEINVTLLRIDANLELNSSSFKNGETIEANVTLTNNEAFDLIDWLAALGIDTRVKEERIDLYLNLIPINLSAGETKSHVFVYKIPDNNTYSELGIFGGAAKTDYGIVSSEGTKKALIYKLDEIVINLTESDLDNDGIPDSVDPDDDNDGINDTDDNLLGNESNIKSNLDNLSISVDNSTNISKIFDDIHSVEIFSDSELVLEFDYNFSYEILNLHNVEVYKQNTTNKGSLIIIGISLPGNLTKTVYLDDLNETIDSVCIEDEEILSIDEISIDCNGVNEILLDCNGVIFNNYTCTDIGDKYKIEGLKHSGVIEFASLKLFSLNLLEGWNLISVPLNLTNSSVSYLFNGKNITIFSYNNSWFIPTKIDSKLGYWLKINESKNLTVMGTEIENPTIELNEGWNLVGYPLLNESLVNETLKEVNYSVVYGYDGSWLSYVPNRTFNSLETLKPGYGYWVRVP